MAGLNSPMVLAFAGFLLGLGETFIFLFILWSYLLVKLTNSTVVSSYMGSLGLLVGNNPDCGCYLILIRLELYFIVLVSCLFPCLT